MIKGTLLFDFDSTFVTVESIDILAEICLSGNPMRDKIVARIKDITEQGMNREISFPESLQLRLSEFAPHRDHVEELISLLETRISPSFASHIDEIAKGAENIYIVSGGFRDFIVPVVGKFGIPESQVFANEFRYNYRGDVVGIDETNPLAQEGGKILAVKDLGLPRPIIAVGDGGTDYQLREAGVADIFCAYAETIYRPQVASRADKVITCISEIAPLLAGIEGTQQSPEQYGMKLQERR